MLKYYLTAGALKLCSTNALTRSAYRAIGNILGNCERLNGTPPYYYFERLKRNLTLGRKHRILRDGARILEVGTGWVHWEALTIGLIYRVNAVLYDVWDNRQFRAFKKYLGHLKTGLLESDLLSDREASKAIENIGMLDDCGTFEEVYEELGWSYVVESDGSFKALREREFDFVISASVFEHIRRSIIEESIHGWSSLLVPGGYASHSIDISDHLSHYDRSASAKRYLAFTELRWKRWFENRVQYINRIQRSEWLELFNNVGLEVIDREESYCEIDDLRISDSYKHLSEEDLKCRTLKVLLRKPE